MKKLLRLGILCGVLTVLLCVSALAVESGTGFYDIGKTDGVTITPDVTTKTDAVWGTDPEAAPPSTLYNDSTKMTVSATGATDGGQYLLLLTTATSLTNINSDNIFFIDQASASGTTVTFNNVYPKQMAASGQKAENATLYIIGSGYSKSVTLNYANNVQFVAPLYTLGDVDGQDGIDPTDALWALQGYVTSRELSATQRKAADVNKDSTVDPTDALWILQRYVTQRDANWNKVQ